MKNKNDKKRTMFSTFLDEDRVRAIDIAVAKGLEMKDGKRLRSRSMYIEILLNTLIPNSEAGVRELWEYIKNRET